MHTLLVAMLNATDRHDVSCNTSTHHVTELGWLKTTVLNFDCFWFCHLIIVTTHIDNYYCRLGQAL